MSGNLRILKRGQGSKKRFRRLQGDLLNVACTGTTIGRKHVHETKHFQEPMFRCIDVGVNATGELDSGGRNVGGLEGGKVGSY